MSGKLEFKETFYETPTADPTVHKSTRPVQPGSYLPNRNEESLSIYQDSDGQRYSFTEGSSLRCVPTLHMTSQERMKETCWRII